MKVQEFYYKLERKIHVAFVTAWMEQEYKKYCSKYTSYKHSLKHTIGDVSLRKEDFYFAAKPNPGAGIGHQMANWIAGYWFAKRFGLRFAHIPFSHASEPFSPDEWDVFLGFGENEVNAFELKKKGYRCVLLPFFDENNEEHIKVIQNIIESYSGQQVLFIEEQDQFYHDQYGVMDDLQKKFYNSPARNGQNLIYDEKCYNIAIHVRRGDIIQKAGENNPNLTMRWLENDYFVNALKNTLKIVKTDKPIAIFLFSQGKQEDYSEFAEYENVHYCLDMSAMDSFLHMVYADAIITSKSSFSYKPALLNRGLKFCPANFWHGYPDELSWILLDDTGMPIKV